MPVRVSCGSCEAGGSCSPRAVRGVWRSHHDCRRCRFAYRSRAGRTAGRRGRHARGCRSGATVPSASNSRGAGAGSGAGSACSCPGCACQRPSRDAYAHRANPCGSERTVRCHATTCATGRPDAGLCASATRGVTAIASCAACTTGAAAEGPSAAVGTVVAATAANASAGWDARSFRAAASGARRRLADDAIRAAPIVTRCAATGETRWQCARCRRTSAAGSASALAVRTIRTSHAAWPGCRGDAARRTGSHQPVPRQ